MWPVWVLLWKHCLARKRNIFSTLFECLAPLLILVVIYLSTQQVLEIAKPKPVHRTKPFSYDDPFRQHERGSILFTPETRFTNQLMDEVGAKLNISRLDNLPNSEETGYFPFSNDMALSIMNYSKGMKPGDAIVIFEDRYGVERTCLDMWPKRLNYTIRMKNNIVTDEYEPTQTGFLRLFGMEHHEDFGQQYEAFMRVQWALDTSYLRLLSGANVNQTLAVQEFPPARPVLDVRPMMICMIAAMFLPLGILRSYTSLTANLYWGKNSGMHELLKMSGVSWEALAISHVLDLIPFMLIYVVGSTLLYELAGFMHHVGSGYIAVALALEFLSVIALVFALVYLFDITRYATFVFLTIFFATYIASLLLIINRLLYFILLPHGPFVQFWFSLGFREQRGIGITSIWYRDPSDNIVIAECYLLMALHTLVLAIVAWYLSRVRPGKFGQALPWNFLCVKDYWCVPKTTAAPRDTQIVSEDDQQYFEKAPVGLPAGIDIINVYKSFGKESVLHGVNLAVYRGEITVLLGHNGAGKTTLLNIITGLISATSGRVLVEGKDTVKQVKEVRNRIGLCTQENIFFKELTVLQHATFFAMIKGKSCSQARASATKILARLNLSDKAGKFPDELSGGMKRRVQLASALAGGARVLMLDEPTSGIDVETRRELWDLLLSLRGDRTVLLTTHFMEEADALGDRIAALHHGRVKCHATSMFLKRAIGTGYRLSFTTTGAPKEAAITATITAIVPDATVRDKRPNGIAYNLPAKDTARFPDLFAALEEKRSELLIDTIGVGKSTLDDVFMKLCSDEKLTYMEDFDATVTEPAFEKVTGAKLCARQFAALLLRQWRFIWSNKRYLPLLLLYFVFLFYIITESSNNSPFGNDQSKKGHTTVTLDLDLYAARPERRALVNADKHSLQALRMSFRGVEFEAVPDVTGAVLRAGMEENQEYLIGIEINDTSAKAMYTSTRRHAAPVALNTLSNALAARMRASSDAEPSMLAEPRQITVRHHPLRDAYVPYNEAELKQSKDGKKIKSWATYIVFMSAMYLVSLAQLPYLERAAGTRHALVMAGAPRVLVWGATLIAHLAQALIFCVVPLLALSATVDRDSTFDQHSFLLVLCVILILGFLAFLGLMYLVTTLLVGEPTLTIVLTGWAFLNIIITPNIPESVIVLYNLTEIAYVLVPAHALTVGVMRAGAVAGVNAYCNLNRAKCPTLVGPGGFEATKCCGSSPGSEPWSYWSLGDGVGWAVIFLVGQTVAFYVLTLLADGGMLGRLRVRCCRAAPPPLRFVDTGAGAQAEAVYVAKAIKMPKEQIPDAILCHNLQKNFPKCCNFKKSFFAVNGLTFSVKKGECFGLLGVNGAGKTTTFSMLTGAASPTGGDIFANGHRISEGVSYMRTFSYCPQFFGVDVFLTGRQNLAVLLTMRGLLATAVSSVTAHWIEEVDLTNSADKPVSSYSGGMARRLAAAAALCQAAPVAVLDEPTAGVDPLARRHMHMALMRAKQNRSIIIASHSMDEMEALCHRIAIMSGGELRALGSAAALKAQFGKGYSVVFKLTSDQDAEAAAMLAELKSQVSASFECDLRDEHRGMLTYHVKESLRYSELFSQLEHLREQFPTLVEDYTVTETTLEEVFLILAKEARAQPSAAPAHTV